MTGTTAVDADEARRLRDALTDKLMKVGRITFPAIEAAFRTVPRHAFARPGTPLEECYRGNVGIDPEVTGWAAAALGATGYGDRVTVVTGDGEHGAPGHGSFDAIIATAGAWDIPPSWTAQLTDNGTLVVPLRANGVTCSIAFRKYGSQLASTSAETCGFVPMQGAGAQPETFFQIPARGGGHITLWFEDGAPAGPPLPDDVLAGCPATAWSGLTMADMTPWCDV